VGHKERVIRDVLRMRLAKAAQRLWDNDAVRLQAGGPAEVGKTKIYTDDKQWEHDPKRSRRLSYKPEVKDVQLVGDWAFEWGYFTASVQDIPGTP
jgi:hypothetical protein